MLEPYEGKLSRTVLRGERRSNATDLPDQILENKQRFISQIMTSKTPARSADDVDEATLSYAEIKAIATGNPLIKEKMDIDVKLERIKMALAEFLKSHETLENKVKKTYPNHLQETQTVLDNIKSDIETVNQNTTFDENGKENFSIILNNQTFTDKKEASAFIADFIKKSKNSSCPLFGLTGEYKGLHISTAFDSMLQREEIILTGKFATKKNSSSIAGDNINRIIEMAKGRTKAAEIKQIEIDGLNDKIQAGIAELAQPFPQQEEYEKLSLRSAELTTLLNQDAEVIKNNEDIHSESMLRINSILNLPPDSLSKCETEFFDFAKKNLSAADNNWSPALDEKSVQFLLDEGFSKESVSDTLLKFSPSVPGKENVHQIIENCTSRAASCR